MVWSCGTTTSRYEGDAVTGRNKWRASHTFYKREPWKAPVFNTCPPHHHHYNHVSSYRHHDNNVLRRHRHWRLANDEWRRLLYAILNFYGYVRQPICIFWDSSTSSSNTQHYPIRHYIQRQSGVEKIVNNSICIKVSVQDQYNKKGQKLTAICEQSANKLQEKDKCLFRLCKGWHRLFFQDYLVDIQPNMCAKKYNRARIHCCRMGFRHGFWSRETKWKLRHREYNDGDSTKLLPKN